MNPDEFKIVIEALKGLADGTISAIITYMILFFVVPILKYSIVCVTIYKTVGALINKVKVEKKKCS